MTNFIDIDPKRQDTLSNIANHGLSGGTWSSFKVALKALGRWSSDSGVIMEFPLSNKQVLTSWPGCPSATSPRRLSMYIYLARIRQCYLTEGVDLSILRTPVVSLVLEGQKQLDVIRKQDGEDNSPLPITPMMLKLVKSEIKQSDEPSEDKLLIWAVATLAFNGRFRIHELLAQKISSFNPCHTLLARDVAIKNKEVTILQITLKSQKTDKSGSKVIVDVHESKGPLCPIRAYDKWRRHCISTR